MSWFTDSDLVQSGSWVLGIILLLSVIMWALILERYWFIRQDMVRFIADATDQWHRGSSYDARVNQRLRYGLTSGFHARLGRGLGTIQVIAAILPMLGLLGTVIGMIKTFEVMTVFGNSNIRGMAEGISQALITTMAGLITALSGIFFADQIEQHIETQTEELGKYLTSTPDREDE